MNTLRIIRCLLGLAALAIFNPAHGQSVVIDNRVGAGGVLGVTVASRTRPDGYTLMIGTNTTMAAPGKLSE